MKDLERIRLNAIIHGQRENLRELNEIRDILKKEIARLQEQLKEANELLNLYFPKKRINSVCVKPINDYKTRWGVK